MASRETVKEVVLMLVDVYGRELQNPKGFLDTASKILARVGDDDLRRAAEAHVAKSRFFPSLAELMAAAKALPVRAEGAQERPLTPLEQIEAARWGLWPEIDRELCRRMEVYERAQGEAGVPAEWREEYRRWIEWVATQSVAEAA